MYQQVVEDKEVGNGELRQIASPVVVACTSIVVNSKYSR